ncbi:B12-binding domain-containing radical SAM protein [Anaerophilus nitritogenes]|uniref:B12-binding domain-containing radical SAM protein n=1 Tax=Anaerophilus nitritogenes TaxID=2498136 RepID=UPI00101C20B3|nr:B12-binding domain-containing radical SAM protein [Anaerophilus nitritogenes]
MKILLTTLNSKYIHTTLSLRYLYQYCKDDFSMEIKEYTINHHTDYVLGEIYKDHYDLVCFSCYIWNVNHILEIVRNLKKIRPDMTIVLGGPEVSFDGRSLMEKENKIDYIIYGEGEETFKELLSFIVDRKGKKEGIKGIIYREDNKVYQNEERPLIKDLSKIPSPYRDGILEDENKIIYYETSRGCPHNCKYCLSSTVIGVRFFPIERVKRDLKLFLERKVKQVKFVDRTFNVKKSHSFEIMKYICENDNGYTNFHFEITADLLDDETINFLATVREGLFQFEIGVQTTYDQTMKSIDRHVDFHILSRVVKKISSFKNIHLHLDLIAGLPFESFERFKQSFDDVYALEPEKLQLGFLKLLKGSPIRKEEYLHEYIYREEAPYEVLQNKYITYEEILKLKMIEEMVETFFNSHVFHHSVQYIINKFYNRSSQFYEELAAFWQEKGYHHISHAKNGLYEILISFYKENQFADEEIFTEILKFDYLMQGKGNLPYFFKKAQIQGFHERIHDFLHKEENVMKYLPKYKGVPAKQIIKKVHFDNFEYNIVKIIENPLTQDIKKEKITILFDYELDHKVFEKAKYKKISI